jgi:hypothetical protein
MSESSYIEELENNLTKTIIKAEFYEKHFKHLVCHHEYEQANYCPQVFTSVSMIHCWFCKLPFCKDHIAKCQTCFNTTCQKCIISHACCDHTNLPDEWVDGCENCQNPLCDHCIDQHDCPE